MLMAMTRQVGRIAMTLWKVRRAVRRWRGGYKQPGRPRNTLTLDSAVNRYHRVMERTFLARSGLTAPPGYRYELGLDDNTNNVWVHMSTNVIDTKTGEVVEARPTWAIERCSGDVWLIATSRFDKVGNIYGEPK